jgi:hypothetical protein
MTTSVEGISLGSSRRPAHVISGILLLGFLAFGAAIMALPESGDETLSASPPSAIGGGPAAVSERTTGGMDCQTDDGAPYVARRCSTGEQNESLVELAR